MAQGYLVCNNLTAAEFEQWILECRGSRGAARHCSNNNCPIWRTLMESNSNRTRLVLSAAVLVLVIEDRVAEHDPALDHEHEHEWLSRQLAVGSDIY